MVLLVGKVGSCRGGWRWWWRRMYAVEKLGSYISRGVYTFSGPFHPFGGAVDIIVVQQEDGSFKSSPWYVRFGKFQGVLKTREKVVSICVNGVDAGFHMYLDHKGEAYFLRDVEAEDGDFVLSSSPQTSGDEMDGVLRSPRFTKAKSCREPLCPTAGDGKIITRTNSRPSGILRLMFGHRSMKENNNDQIVERASSMERAEIAASLLETKWSTNLPPNIQRTDSSTKVSVINKERSSEIPPLTSHVQGVDDNIRKDNSEEVRIQESSSLGATQEVISIKALEKGDLIDRIKLVSDQTTLETRESDDTSDKLGMLDLISDKSVLTGDHSPTDLSYSDETEASVGLHGRGLGNYLQSSNMKELRYEDNEAVQITSLGTSNSPVNSEVSFDFLVAESDEFNVPLAGSVLRDSDSNDQNPSFLEPSFQSNQALSETYNTSSYRVSNIENDGKEVISVSYSEALAHLPVNTQESMNLSSDSGEQFEHHHEIVCEKSEFTSEIIPQSESTCTNEGNMEVCQHQRMEIHTVEDCSFYEDPQADGPSKRADNMTADVSICDSSLIDSSGQSFSDAQSPPEADLRPCESKVINQEKVTKELSLEEEASSERVDFLEDGTRVKEESESFTWPVNCSQCSGFVHPLCPSEDSAIQSACNVGEGSEVESALLADGVDIAQAVELTSLSVEAVKSIAPSSEISRVISEDDEFIFGDIEISAVKEVNSNQLLGNTVVDHLEDCCTEDVDDGQVLESFSVVSVAHASPMTIPRSQSRLDECGLSTGSLPIIRSYIHNLESSVLLHPLSCPMYLNSGTNEHNLLKSENCSPSKLKVDPEGNVNNFISKDAARAGDADKWGEQKDMPLSGCLLFERLGTNASSRAFNAEKEEIVEPQGMIAVDLAAKDLEEDNRRAMILSEGSWKLWPFFRRSNTITTVRPAPESTVVTDVDSASVDTINSRRGDVTQKPNATKKKKVRSLAPTSEELASLNLKEGSNMITFTFSTAMLGNQQVDARIYLWKWNTRIVVSDVDGTITKSDVLGQFMPLVGVDWSHTGVTHLFSAIKENGYQLLFLSARSISQAYITRQFLFNLKQDGKALPDGPVVISPDGLFPSLYREVIRRAPHEFKISCLEDIRVLFPPDCNPFYAGFGNRDTDEISYRKVGIPKGKIFIINPKGEIAVNRRVDTKSYTSLHALVSGMFPPMSSAEQEDYNSWNYWKLPLPDVPM